LPFAVQDFQDLLRLLDEHPEWQAELRRRILTDELLELPALVRRIAEGQARTDEQLGILTARVDSLTAHVEILTARVDSLAERLDTLTARVDSLTIQVQKLTVRVDALAERLDTLTARVDSLTVQVEKLTLALMQTDATVKAQGARLDAAIGDLAEARYERRAGAYFSHLARRIRVVDSSSLADLLEDAVDEGRIARGERQDAMRTDLVLTGRRRGDGADIYFAVEVSVGIGVDDVRRAADRAAVLAKLGRPAIPVVAGERIDPEPAELARAQGVEQVLNARPA
jgi:uncharacterized protein YoxC